LAKRMIATGLSPRERAFLTLAFIGLTAPFMPVPGDHATRIAVQFRRPGMIAARAFDARTEASICTLMRTTLSFGNPPRGIFTRIDCGPR